MSPTHVEEEEDQLLNLEAQGIMVYDRTTGAESHVRLNPILLLSVLTQTDNVDGPAIDYS